MTGDMIRVILADDHAVVRSGLRSVLGSAPDITVVGEAWDGQQAVELAARCRPDVVIMDVSMPRMDGMQATREIVAREIPTRVLILTMYSEEEFLLAGLEAGAAGYLVKTAAERELVDAVRALAHGDMYVQPRAARLLSRRAALGTRDPRESPVSEDAARLERLTEREKDVLRLVAEGYSAPEVGDRLDISAKTVDTYKQRIADKIDLAGRPAYVRFALRVGLLRLAPAPADGAQATAHVA